MVVYSFSLLKKIKFLFFFSFLITRMYLLSAQNNLSGTNILTLADVAELTLKNNKNLIVSENKLESAKADIYKAKSEFNLTFEGNIYKDYSKVPTTIDSRENLIFTSNSSYYESDLFQYNISSYKKLKFGTVINPGITFTNYGKDSLYEYGYGNYITNRSNVYFRITQPLLNGFGKKYNTTFIRVNEKQFTLIKKEHFNTIALSLLESYSAYVKYIGAKRKLEIHENVNKQLLRVIDQIETLIEMDAIPASDLNYLMANYSVRKSELLNTQNHLNNQKLNLEIKMGVARQEMFDELTLPDEFMISDIDLTAIDSDKYINYSYIQSLERRPDYQSFKVMVDIKQDLVDYYKKSMKQTVNLDMAIGYNGIYESDKLDQFYKPYFENIPGVNYKIGLSFNINPKNELNRANLLLQVSDLKSQIALKDQIQENLYVNIKKTFNNLKQLHENTKLYRETVSYYKTALENERTKLHLGSSTVINLVQIQNDYYQALDLLNDAIMNLNIEILNYRYYTGSLCAIDKESNIEIDYLNLFTLPFTNEVLNE